MNERILELALQAGYLPDGFGIGHWDMPECKKFAELIVKECLSVIEEMNPHDPKRDIDDMFDEVYEHFGVE